MKITVLTLFPEMYEGFLKASIIKRIIEKGLAEVKVVNIRDYSLDKHHHVDDTPYGGGAGMLMMAQPIADAMKAVCEKRGIPCRKNMDPISGIHPLVSSATEESNGEKPLSNVNMGKVSGEKPSVVPDEKTLRIYLSPRGVPLTQRLTRQLAEKEHLILLCGHYEGVDQRALDQYIDLEISLGDYVLTGGELGAMVLTDCVARLIPGVLGSEESPEDESFSDAGLLEYPQYTRPRVFEGMEVPEVLLNGDHAKIAAWRREQAIQTTALRRPELLELANLTEKEKQKLVSLQK